MEKTVISDHQGLWHQNGPTSSSIRIEDADEAARCSNILDNRARFELVDSLLLQEVNLGENPSSDDVFEEGHSSGAKRKLSLLDNGVKEDLDTGDQSKQQIKSSPYGLRNQNERKKRQQQKEKLKILQQLIPNCNKRDRSSILDDAIKYIKLLQHQVQMMSIRAYYSTFHSPMMMMQEAGQQEMQMPCTSFMQTCPPRGSSNTGEMEYGIGMGTPFKSHMSQTGLPNPYFLTPSATSRLPLESLSNTAPSYMDWMPFYYTPSSGPEPTTSQGPMSKQSFTWMESTARVLPSKVVQSHLTKEVMDCGSSNSTSNEWPHSSTARKPEEHKFLRKGPF